MHLLICCTLTSGAPPGAAWRECRWRLRPCLCPGLGARRGRPDGRARPAQGSSPSASRRPLTSLRSTARGSTRPTPPAGRRCGHPSRLRPPVSSSLLARPATALNKRGSPRPAPPLPQRRRRVSSARTPSASGTRSPTSRSTSPTSSRRCSCSGSTRGTCPGTRRPPRRSRQPPPAPAEVVRRRVRPRPRRRGAGARGRKRCWRSCRPRPGTCGG